VPIDVTVPNSPGWWMQTLWRQLQAEQPRLRRLEAYRRGEPQMVMGRGQDRMRTAFYRFQNMSRSNFAELIVSARTNRMAVRAIRTAATNDDNGDQEAWRIFSANGLAVWQTDLFRSMCTFGAGYVAVGAPDDPTDEPTITIEDPRSTITAQDPLRPAKTVAAFKIYHDPIAQMDYTILWVPGEKWVAQRSRKARATLNGEPVAVNFSPAGFDMVPFGQPASTGGVQWDDDQPDSVLDVDTFDDGYEGITSEKYDMDAVPVVKFGNRDGVGVFELHTDLLDRIAHITLQQMVIATLQAFKQRAIETSTEAGEDGGLPDEDEHGNPIDYNEVFEADPGALWRLPIGAKIWESGQVDLSGILAASKDYVLHLAACTQTPFPMFSPDSANQSANGASLYREGLTFNVEDLCRIAGAGLAHVIALAFAIKGRADSDRTLPTSSSTGRRPTVTRFLRWRRRTRSRRCRWLRRRRGSTACRRRKCRSRWRRRRKRRS
jgi:hypothetical protein